MVSDLDTSVAVSLLDTITVVIDRMPVTTFQKVTLISCSVLCLSLFLPKMLLPSGSGKKDVGQADGKADYNFCY